MKETAHMDPKSKTVSLELETNVTNEELEKLLWSAVDEHGNVKVSHVDVKQVHVNAIRGEKKK